MLHLYAATSNKLPLAWIACLQLLSWYACQCIPFRSSLFSLLVVSCWSIDIVVFRFLPNFFVARCLSVNLFKRPIVKHNVSQIIKNYLALSLYQLHVTYLLRRPATEIKHTIQAAWIVCLIFFTASRYGGLSIWFLRKSFWETGGQIDRKIILKSYCFSQLKFGTLKRESFIIIKTFEPKKNRNIVKMYKTQSFYFYVEWEQNAFQHNCGVIQNIKISSSKSGLSDIVNYFLCVIIKYRSMVDR